MSEIENYLNGAHKEKKQSSLSSSFNEIMQEVLAANPRITTITTEYTISVACQYLQKLHICFLHYFPKGNYKNLLLACAKRTHPKRVCDLLKAETLLKKDEIMLITHAVCYALEVCDIDCSSDIRGDYLRKCASYLTELSTLEEVKHGKKFKSNRPKNSIGPQAIHIRELVQKYPTISAKELPRLPEADQTIIGKMSDTAIAAQLTKARRALHLPKPKKSQKSKIKDPIQS